MSAASTPIFKLLRDDIEVSPDVLLSTMARICCCPQNTPLSPDLTLLSPNVTSLSSSHTSLSPETPLELGESSDHRMPPSLDFLVLIYAYERPYIKYTTRLLFSFGARNQRK